MLLEGLKELQQKKRRFCSHDKSFYYYCITIELSTGHVQVKKWRFSHMVNFLYFLCMSNLRLWRLIDKIL